MNTPTITDWLMVGITAIYVVATILICYANLKSAKASREQVAESQKQFDEENRAFVSVTFEIIRSGLAVLRIQNYGKRIARNVNIQVSSDFLNNISDEFDKKHLTALRSSKFTLGIGQSWYVSIGSHLQLKDMSRQLLEIEITYDDAYGHYKEPVTIDLAQYFWALLYDSPTEDTYQEMKKLSKSIQSIDASLKKINNKIPTPTEQEEKPNA